ncbi:hypothetical protein ACA910_003806 [Epithemia clementina (nom. ined.)]
MRLSLLLLVFIAVPSKCAAEGEELAELEFSSRPLPPRLMFPRFQVHGPVITMTLKEPTTKDAIINAGSVASKSAKLSSFVNDQQHQEEHQLHRRHHPSTGRSSSKMKHPTSPALILLKSLVSSIRPKVTWSIQTATPFDDEDEDDNFSILDEVFLRPLPKWVPSLRQVRANATYDYQSLNYAPSRMESTWQFRTQIGDFWIQPSWNIPDQATDWSVSMSRGSSFIRARWVLGKEDKNDNNNNNNNIKNPRRPGGRSDSNSMYAQQQRQSSRLSLKDLLGSFYFDLPYKSLQSIRLNPQLDFSSSYPDFTCQIEATIGGGGGGGGGLTGAVLRRQQQQRGRWMSPPTKAILNLEYNNPTLSVVHPINEWNTVSPEISIYSAKITYQWDVKLNSNGSSTLCTKIDPMDAITLTWTDPCQLGGGSWVADLRLPLTPLPFPSSQSQHQSSSSPSSSMSSSSALLSSSSSTSSLSGQGGRMTAIAAALTADIRIRRQFKF